MVAVHLAALVVLAVRAAVAPGFVDLPLPALPRRLAPALATAVLGWGYLDSCLWLFWT